MNRKSLTFALAAIYVLASCSSSIPKWSVSYMEPSLPLPSPLPRGLTPSPPCLTYVFGRAGPDFAVATVKGWAENRVGPSNTTVLLGENFSGPLELGSATIHDDSNGYDLNVEVIYKTDSSTTAKAKADATCAATHLTSLP
jgi:hypothetical protein